MSRKTERSKSLAKSKFKSSGNAEKFIGEIKKRPALYDPTCPGYTDRDTKATAWDEICRCMLPKWDSLSTEDKLAEEKNLKNKWRNIRDHFIKDLRQQKSLGGRKRRVRYSYYNHLLFLVPFSRSTQLRKALIASTTPPPIEVDCKIEESSGGGGGGGETEEDINVSNDNYEITTAAAASTSDERFLDPLGAGGMTLTSFEKEIPSVMSSPYEEDYDKMFLLSLLPAFRQVPENMKLEVRIQMQQVLASAFNAIE